MSAPLSAVTAILADLTGARDITAVTPLSSITDSLGLVEIQQAIADQLGVEVPDDVLGRVEIVADLVAAVEGGRRHD